MLSLLLVSARKLTHTKSQLGDFGLATNLSLFFFRDVSVFLLCPTKISFFLVGKEYLGVKKLNSPPNQINFEHTEDCPVAGICLF